MERRVEDLGEFVNERYFDEAENKIFMKVYFGKLASIFFQYIMDILRTNK